MGAPITEIETPAEIEQLKNSIHLKCSSIQSELTLESSSNSNM